MAKHEPVIDYRFAQQCFIRAGVSYKRKPAAKRIRWFRYAVIVGMAVVSIALTFWR